MYKIKYESENFQIINWNLYIFISHLITNKEKQLRCIRHDNPGRHRRMSGRDVPVRSRIRFWYTRSRADCCRWFVGTMDAISLRLFYSQLTPVINGGIISFKSVTQFRSVSLLFYFLFQCIWGVLTKELWDSSLKV